MISDVLYDSVEEIVSYQSEYEYVYDSMNKAIEKVKAVMNALRTYFDLPPADGSCPRYDAAVEQLRLEIEAINLEGVMAALENIKPSWPTSDEYDALKKKDSENEL